MRFLVRRAAAARQSVNSCSSVPASVTSSVRSAIGKQAELLRDDLALLGDLDAAAHVPGGSAASARYTGEPPPRPTLPPRP